mgnify:CR=1 FL=1
MNPFVLLGSAALAAGVLCATGAVGSPVTAWRRAWEHRREELELLHDRRSLLEARLAVQVKGEARGWRRWLASQHLALVQAEVPLRVWEYLALRAGTALAAGWFVFWCHNPVLIGAFAVLGFQAPAWFLHQRRERRVAGAEREMYPVFRHLVDNYIRLSDWAAAARRTLETLPEERRREREELEHFARLCETRVPVEVAFTLVGERLGIAGMDVFARKAKVAEERGGHARERLLALPQLLAERVVWRDTVRSRLSSMSRMALLLIALNPAFLVMMRFARADLGRMLTDTAIGQAGLTLFGLVWVVLLVLYGKLRRPLRV